MYGHPPTKIIRVDRGTSEMSEEVRQYLLELKNPIRIEPCGIEEQQQNPVERLVQTWIKGVSATLADQYSLSAKNWDLASDFWISARNNSPNFNTNSSPSEIITGQPTDISKKFQIPFGCPVTINEKQRDHKCNFKNKFGIAVGASEKNNGDIKHFCLCSQKNQENRRQPNRNQSTQTRRLARMAQSNSIRI